MADQSMLLFDIPPAQIETFCKIMDSGIGTLGWKGLAARISPSWLDVRCTELREAAGRSPTQELLWSWAQQNKTVGDLLRVLEDMGHQRALSLFQSTGNHQSLPKPPPPSLEVQKPEPLKSECPSESLPSGSGSVASVTAGNRARLKVSFADIIEGTGNFHQDKRIGGGTFSDVYRGIKGNETFVVKVFKQVQNTSWKLLWEKFCREMEVLHLYQHPNILELSGCFSDGDRYFLVYPFLPNGSLHRKLHNQDAGKALSWQERLEVIKGTAKAIHHLHSTQPCAVICANISSANILLDERLQPKLTDFGMARLRPHSVNQSCTITMKTSIHGNLGYLPEEYIRDGKLSVKLDVYSFGMVVLEILTGQQVMQDKPKHRPLRGMLDDVAEEGGGVDACLRLLDSSAGCWPHSVALCLLRLGMESSSSKTKSRPIMDVVLQTLSQLLPLPCPPMISHAHWTMVWPSKNRVSPPQYTVPACLWRMMRRPVFHRWCGRVQPDSVSVLKDSAVLSNQSRPCECSQSEVTFLGCMDHNGGRPGQKERQQQQQRRQSDGRDKHTTAAMVTSAPASACVSVHTLQSDGGGEAALDLYGSWPVQCSCAPDADAQECEDCRANGFSPLPLNFSQGVVSGPAQSYMENPAKQRIRNKIQLYNHGLLCTDELLSITP